MGERVEGGTLLILSGGRENGAVTPANKLWGRPWECLEGTGLALMALRHLIWNAARARWKTFKVIIAVYLEILCVGLLTFSLCQVHWTGRII